MLSRSPGWETGEQADGRKIIPPPPPTPGMASIACPKWRAIFNARLETDNAFQIRDMCPGLTAMLRANGKENYLPLTDLQPAPGRVLPLSLLSPNSHPERRTFLSRNALRRAR